MKFVQDNPFPETAKVGPEKEDDVSATTVTWKVLDETDSDSYVNEKVKMKPENSAKISQYHALEIEHRRPFVLSMVEELALLIKDNLFIKHLVLSTEETLVDFIHSDSSSEGILMLKPMGSYERLLMHRLADIFGLDHESVGEGDNRHLVLQRCPESSMPPVLVGDILGQIDGYQPVTGIHILKREVDPALMKREAPLFSASVKEREAAYEAARERIFSIHTNEQKEPVAVKPRNVPIVARRMIAHALGNSNADRSLHRNHNTNRQNGKISYSNATSNRNEATKCPNTFQIQEPGLKLQGKYASKNVGRNKVNRIEPTNHSYNSKSVSDGCKEKTGSPRNVGREVGAAQRIFAHALGLPSVKGSKCKETSKDYKNVR